MLAALYAYDADGNIIATLDALVQRDENGQAVGLVDFEAMERAGLPLRLRPDGSAGVWNVSRATGSGTWPEWLGPASADFKVELDGGRIVGLVHKTSGHRRDRADVEAKIAARIQEADGGPADIRDLVGGPSRPIRLDAKGRGPR